MDAVELAGQVESVLVTVVGVADRRCDRGLPTADRRWVEGVDLALEMARVAVGGEITGAWAGSGAQQAAVVVGYAVGSAPDGRLGAELVGEDVSEAMECRR